MPTPDESTILKIIEAEGGECTVGRIAVKMCLDPSYIRIILRSMGESDIIDIFRSSKVRIANKGWVVLGRKTERPDGLKRYLEDCAKWKTF